MTDQDNPRKVPERPRPRTWLLTGHKAGDNAQLLALAEALGFPFEPKRLAYRATELATNLLAGPNLLGLVLERSDSLGPPWPGLVLTAGRRNEPVARWVREQAGGRDRVKIVHVGRPWAPLGEFDLVVTTPQYNLPAAPNVLDNEAPLHRVTPERLAAARAAWAPRLAHLPAPYVAVVLGGHSGPYTFDREAGALLGERASRMARELGGSLLVTTSARTPAEAATALEERLDAPHELYRWRPGAAAADNPYLGYLALADRVIVTCESMSMLVDAIATGRPVLIFDLARGPGSHRPREPGVPPPTWRERAARRARLQPVWYRLGQLAGPRQLRRDVGAIHRRQIEAGRAAWLGDPVPDPAAAPPLRDAERAAERVRALFEPPPSRPPHGAAAA
jgi:mitochondrial fission protein ELM1